jgi:uncharacterized membrane protein (Fun14 family)
MSLAAEIDSLAVEQCSGILGLGLVVGLLVAFILRALLKVICTELRLQIHFRSARRY